MDKAEDIMTKEVLTVMPQTPISMAIKILTIRKVSGLPVIDEDQNLMGVISEKDLLEILLGDDDFENKTVSEFMSREVISFSPEDSVDTICEFLMKNPFRRVPIAQDGKLRGLISRADIISLIFRTRFKNSGSPSA